MLAPRAGGQVVDPLAFKLHGELLAPDGEVIGRERACGQRLQLPLEEGRW